MSGAAPARAVSVQIALPGVQKISELELEISSTEIVLSGGGFALKHSLPFAVDESLAAAKFSSKAGSLRVKAPEAA